MMTKLFVPGNPIPKARARVIVRANRAHAFTPKRTQEWERLVRDSYNGELCTGSVEITLRFWRANKVKCDIDNLIKAVLDALNGKAWNDDDQIVEIHAVKGVWKEHPGVEIEVIG